jgi:hypothetical protein
MNQAESELLARAQLAEAEVRRLTMELATEKESNRILETRLKTEQDKFNALALEVRLSRASVLRQSMKQDTYNKDSNNSGQRIYRNRRY